MGCMHDTQYSTVAIESKEESDIERNVQVQYENEEFDTN